MSFWSEYYKNQTQQQILNFFQIYNVKVSTLNILIFSKYKIFDFFFQNIMGKLATDQVVKFFKMQVEKDNTLRFCKILQFS